MTSKSNSSPSVKGLLAKFNESNSRTALQEGMLLLAKRGWFVTLRDMPVSAIPRVASWIKNGETDDVDYALTEYFQNAMPRLMLHVAKAFPARCNLIERAYMAHSLALYDFSIPIFLAQADGIGKEIFGISPNTRRPDAISKLKKFVEMNFETKLHSGSYWQLVYSLLPISASKNDSWIWKQDKHKHTDAPKA